jgi:hypothetical protein
MPNIFSFPFRLHSSQNIRELCNDSLGRLSWIFMNQNPGDLFPHIPEGDYRRLLRALFWYLYSSEFLVLNSCTSSELLQLVLRTGLFRIAKKLSKVISAPNFLHRSHQMKVINLRNLLMDGNPDPLKSYGMRLTLAFLALSILKNRSLLPVEHRSPWEMFSPLELTQLQHIIRMMEHSFFRPDVVELLRSAHRDCEDRYVAFNQDQNNFTQAYLVYLARAAWFPVMVRDVLEDVLVLPPPQPAPIAAQVPIQQIV